MKRVQLAHGNIAPGSSLLVELIKNSGADAHPTVLVTWPRVSEISPARFAEVVSNACWLLGNASTELARRRIMPGRVEVSGIRKISICTRYRRDHI
jgi:hypothetical protein